MKGAAFQIPFFQPLPPADFFARRQDLSTRFPFSAPALQHYYLARNAIWSGVDALGLKAGDTILVPAYHHGVEIAVLLAKGFRVVYYGVDDALRIDFASLERAWTPEVRALYVIHYLGVPQPIESIQAFAEERALPYIEDCALSLFSTTERGPLGSFGDLGVFCLYKTLPLPHGGTLVLNRPGLALPPPPDPPDSLSSLAMIGNRSLDYLTLRLDGAGHQIATWGREAGRAVKRALRATPVPIATNELDISTIRLGMGRTTRHLLDRTRADDVVHARRRNYEHLASRLGGSVRILWPTIPPGVCPLSLPILTRDKEVVRERLLEDGVETVNFWARRRPEIPEGAFPAVDFLRAHVLEVPIHQGLEPRHIEYVAERVTEKGAW